MTIALATAAVLGTLFAAVAAVASLKAISQARSFHEQDVEDRRKEREAQKAQFVEEMRIRRLMATDDIQERQLSQLQHISELVAVVRDAADTDAERDGSLEGLTVGGRRGAATYWNARKQLEAAINVSIALGGADLPACRALATGSMSHLSMVIGGATDAFGEIAQLAEWHAEQSRLAVRSQL